MKERRTRSRRVRLCERGARRRFRYLRFFRDFCHFPRHFTQYLPMKGYAYRQIFSRVHRESPVKTPGLTREAYETAKTRSATRENAKNDPRIEGFTPTRVGIYFVPAFNSPSRDPTDRGLADGTGLLARSRRLHLSHTQRQPRPDLEIVCPAPPPLARTPARPRVSSLSGAARSRRGSLAGSEEPRRALGGWSRERVARRDVRTSPLGPGRKRPHARRARRGHLARAGLAGRSGAGGRDGASRRRLRDVRDGDSRSGDGTARDRARRALRGAARRRDARASRGRG